MTSPKPCRVEGCSLPKERPSHSCAWHRLMREPIDVQVAAAREREAGTPDDARLPRVDATGWAPGTRWCAACQSMPPLFYFAPGASQCRACSSASRHDSMIQKTYHLTGEEYSALLTLQDRRCAICRQKPITIRLAVDHDHATGKVRGLLCSRCNHDLLGAGWDNGDRLRNAAAYLDAPPLSGEWKAPKPQTPTRGRSIDRSAADPSYLLFDHDAADQALPPVLQAVVKRMSVDDLILSGGRSDPETGTYWLAYRRVEDVQPPWEMQEAPAAALEELKVAGASIPS